ncbi:MAG TPA: oxygenase MpaB family protein [Pseudonocardiaceae bacterium]|nr:oxygenase MpaB family protein [Pseudonocardiaceae bacterium]
MPSSGLVSGQPRGLPRPLDHGFFGPGSPTWKVWTAPTALLGFQRAVVLEHFDPFLTAAVADQRGIYTDPVGRLDRTLAYFLTVAVADGRTAIRASEFLMTVHAAASGIEPISGKRYSANNPAAQLWIHVTGWHSVLKCYERYGPGPLTGDEERRYWAESVVAAELQTCKPADVPASREQVREYFAEVRPSLCTSERAHEGMHYLLRTPRSNGGLRLWAMSRLMAPAIIATLPHWMRQVGGFDQPAALDQAVLPLTRAAMRAARSPRVKLAVLSDTLPHTRRMLRQHLYGGPPERAETITPAQARARYGRAASA